MGSDSAPAEEEDSPLSGFLLPSFTLVWLVEMSFFVVVFLSFELSKRGVCRRLSTRLTAETSQTARFYSTGFMDGWKIFR